MALWILLAPFPATAQASGPRTADGKPNLNGIWQALNMANWDIQTHGPAQGPPELGAIGAIPPGLGIVEGGELPYLPAASARKKENFANRWSADPELKCYLPGVPRATYMPYPFQIVQGSSSIMIAYEYADAVRPINMGKPREAPADTWMGWSNGHWEGDTLVVDVTGFNGMAWFDRAGNYASDSLKVTERYSLMDPNTMKYEATIEDPKTFSRPWKVNVVLYRHREMNARMLEFKCVEFVEELLYGDIRKKILGK